ncbi:MAG: hypothetical protein WA901_14505, partial [Phormidesmis sp.]
MRSFVSSFGASIALAVGLAGQFSILVPAANAQSNRSRDRATESARTESNGTQSSSTQSNSPQ